MNIPVSTVHIWINIVNDPSLCGADFVGANAQYVTTNGYVQIIITFLDFGSAYYDGGVTSGQAGSFLFNTVKPALEAACPGKEIFITE